MASLLDSLLRHLKGLANDGPDPSRIGAGASTEERKAVRKILSGTALTTLPDFLDYRTIFLPYFDTVLDFYEARLKREKEEDRAQTGAVITQFFEMIIAHGGLFTAQFWNQVLGGDYVRKAVDLLLATPEGWGRTQRETGVTGTIEEVQGRVDPLAMDGGTPLWRGPWSSHPEHSK